MKKLFILVFLFLSITTTANAGLKAVSNNAANLTGIIPTSTPPANPSVGATWLSSNLANMTVDPSPLAHIPLLGGITGQEPNVWYANGVYNLLYSSSSLMYSSCSGTKDPLTGFSAIGSTSGTTLTITAINSGSIQIGMIISFGGNNTTITSFGTGNGAIGTYTISGSVGTIASSTVLGSFWSNPVTVLGGGNGGVTDALAHSSIYIEGSTLYAYFVDTVTNAVGVATAPLSTPTVWIYQNQIVAGTGIGSGTSNGNPRVVLSLGTYYLFQEGLNFDTMPGDGLTDSWQEFECTSTSPLGPFTGCSQLFSLRSGPNSSESNVCIIQQNSTWIAYYHTQPWGRSLPSQIYVATNTNIATDSWIVQNNSSPLIKLSHSYEVDQVADPKLVQSPGGPWYVFFTAGDNTSGGLGFHIMGARLLPALMQWNGTQWINATTTYNNTPPIKNSSDYFFKQNIPFLSPSGVASTGSWALEAATVPGGYLRYNSSNAVNDALQWDIFLPAGTFNLDVYYQTSAAGGINTIKLSDGTNANFPISVGTIDTYSASPSVGHSTLSFILYGTESIRRRMRFQALTKNASSSGFTLADYGWTITRTDL